jgi:hypothetical protein
MIEMWHQDENYGATSKQPLSVALITIELPNGKPPVDQRSFLPVLPCLVDLYAHDTAGGSSRQKAACLAKSVGNNP